MDVLLFATMTDMVGSLMDVLLFATMTDMVGSLVDNI